MGHALLIRGLQPGRPGALLPQCPEWRVLGRKAPGALEPRAGARWASRVCDSGDHTGPCM